MATAGLLALLDDIASTLDDVAALSQVAAEKTAGIAGDDLAVNAQGLVGLSPDRELPVVGKVALGSVANKFVLVPLALALPASWLTPLLMAGGAFLTYEGVHKVAHMLGLDAHGAADHAAAAAPRDPVALERQKVRGAIVTDVVLSAEIVAVALSAIGDADFTTRAVTLSVVALGMTAGIYGLVAVLVKLDDVGLALVARGGGAATVGRFVLAATPRLMKLISLGGTVAMFLVGGGILLHGWPAAEHAVHDLVHALSPPAIEGLLGTVAHGLVGLVLGLLVALVVDGGRALVRRLG
jgi:predicted DNA repair protein MutK